MSPETIIATGRDIRPYVYLLAFQAGRWECRKRRPGTPHRVMWIFPPSYSQEDAARQTGRNLARNGERRPHLQYLDAAAADAAYYAAAPPIGAVE
jgi:hypothetical protein